MVAGHRIQCYLRVHKEVGRCAEANLRWKRVRQTKRTGCWVGILELEAGPGCTN